MRYTMQKTPSQKELHSNAYQELQTNKDTYKDCEGLELITKIPNRYFWIQII